MKKILAEIVAFFKKLFGKLFGSTATTTPSPTPAPAPTPSPTPVTPPSTPAPTLPQGVTLKDPINGLVQIDAAEAVFPNQLYCVFPLLPFLKTGSQAFATVNWNTSSAKLSDQGVGLWVRVSKLVPTKNADGSDGWGNSKPLVWLDNAWSIGSEYDTWDKAIKEATVIATRMATANPGNGGAGFGPNK